MRRTHRFLCSLALATFITQVPAISHADDDIQQPTLALSASASREVKLDTVTITMSYEHHGNSQTQVTQEVNARIGAALAKAKQVSQVKTRTGSLSTWTRFDKDRKPVGWTAKGSLTLESTDLEAASKLAGELSASLSVANSYFSLSRDLRNQTERSLLQDSAKAFQQRSQEAALALGFQRTSIKEIELSGEGNEIHHRSGAPVLAMAAPSMKSDAAPPPPLQLEPGTMVVSVSMRGTVYLLNDR